MASVSIYLNFMGNAEEAFTYYRSVFGGEFLSLARMREMPTDPTRPPLPDAEQDLVAVAAIDAGDQFADRLRLITARGVGCGQVVQ